MKNKMKFLIICIILINCVCSSQVILQNDALKEEKMNEINEEVEDNINYKKAVFEFNSTDTRQFFKYENETLPSSKVSSFRINFDRFTVSMNDYKVYCTNVDKSTSDSELMNILKTLTLKESSCVDVFRSMGYYDGIVKLDETKTKLGIILISEAKEIFTGSLYFRITERVLGTNEDKPMEEETYSLVPFTINIQNFRDLSKSKILFYSSTRVLQMFYVESSSPFPQKLFSGNILSVYTNPNMIRQKYHGANIMILLTNPFGFFSNFRETFKFQVKLFESNYLLDYYVSSNSEGRPPKSPLLINMTECSNPYFIILNYNQEEKEKTLVIDQIYGKLTYLSVATELTQSTWDEMIENDMNVIDINSRKYNLPSNSKSHIDVYKIECELPLMFNFYYIDETDLQQKMNYGDISIFTLKPYETVNIPFFSITVPQIIVEIFNPKEDPIVIIEAQEETIYLKNLLIKITPMTLENGINVKERGGLSDTRIIIKVGYSNQGWQDISGNQYMKYNAELDTYLFEFPNDNSKYNYTLAELTTYGTNSEDNVKYCFTPNIGAALKTSSENCYRVSKDNSYTLKTYNPLVMYKEYEYDEGLSYYITFKAITEVSSFNVEAKVESYDTTLRNYEGINNNIKIDSTGDYSSILTPPKNKELAIFIQVQVCDNENEIKTKIIKPLTGEIMISERTIPAGTKNSYLSFKNDFVDTEFYAIGKQGVNVFLRMVGLSTIYVPSFNNNQKITFDNTTNTLNIQSPITKTEPMKYTVLVDKEGVISNKKLTLCSFVDIKIEDLALYTKSIVTNNQVASIQLNFLKANIAPGEKFEAIVYVEQQTKSQMVFLSNIYEGIVGEIDIETLYEINEEYSSDTSYYYKTVEANKDKTSYYFTYLPNDVLNVPIGAFSLELDQTSTGSFTGVACTFVDNGTDAMSMIEAVEAAVEDNTSYCIGSQSTINSRKYNYIFKYENKNENTPKRMVIKVSNNNNANGKFNIYMKNDQGIIVEKTDFTELKEYGKEENTKKSVIPYIVDVDTLRGKNETDYVSKVLFFSQHLEMQMYYIPEDSNIPIKLFCGNIALVYTKPELAVQKYHATTLVLISENLEGQEHASLGDKFRFHTKMFKSDDQIEFFVSQNEEGRTLNFPLSLQMNTCTKNNNKLYYILNYNKQEPVRTLHLDMIFGSYSTAKIAREINAEKWDSLISNSMSDIINYQAELPERAQHIDVIEITCNSPLLLNAYYSYDNYQYNNVKEGEIVVKELPAENSFSFTIDKGSSSLFFYSISLFNPIESPIVTVRFSDGTEHYFSENSLQTGMLLSIPEKVTIINNSKSKTRFIFKIGFGVETSENWEEVEQLQNLDGTLYANKNKYVYKFPAEENKRNFTKITFQVNSINEIENVKFCYSTNLGIALEASKENCFRTGKKIPYNLTFINPLIVGKNYKVDTDKYYISFRPFNDDDYINIEVHEEQYETSIRNEEGVHSLLTLINRKASTILSLPNKNPSKIIVQLKSCKVHSNPIDFYDYNALSKEEIINGEILYTNKEGVKFYITDNKYLENELQLEGDSGITIFSKHAVIEDSYSPIITNYEVTFDSDTNVATIIKPIYNEEFIITVLIGEKNSLSEITQCDLAFNDKSKYAPYVSSFSSINSNIITHYIDFKNSLNYDEGKEFDLLVYAEQTSNSKMEFIYTVINGKVGKVKGTLPISDFIEGESEYVTRTFSYNSSSNYLYYDFTKRPTGNIASIKIQSESVIVTKIGCTFVSKTSSEEDMINLVNRAVLEGKSVCIGAMQKDYDGFDALVNAKYGDEQNRLVIQVLYGLGENNEELKDNEQIVINMKISGTSVKTNEGSFGKNEPYSTIPYVIDLLEIRNSREEYVSKILFYSNTREMEMFYIDENSSSPVSLFTGNIMLVYTNEELINQKYHGATTMILITDSLTSTEKTIIGEKYRFMIKYFNSAANIQYFLSSNPTGRPLNNPTAIEMTSCNQPYYYILNYNQIEEIRKLHIDTIFGEKESIKIATQLNYESWDSLIYNMDNLDENEYILEAQENFHFDVMEIKCKLPLLLNLFYVDPNIKKVSNLEIGDIVILSLSNNEEQELSFISGEKGPFVYSFSVQKGNELRPNIEITFNEEESLKIIENGVYQQYSFNEYSKILISNKDKSGTHNTRVIFKFGYLVESNFEKIQNDIYSNQNQINRTNNLYGYIYDQTSTKLNFTGVNFEVSTKEDNVKFCYSTNLGTFINPSLQNCYRVGKNNPYTIQTLNPLVMYRNYYSEEHMNYYVGFRTVELNQNITIIPTQIRYDTTERNLEGGKNKIKIPYDNKYSTILTAPENHDDYIFIHIHVCTKNEPLLYEFLNAYNYSNLGFNGEIQANSKNHFKTIINTKLDTELKLSANQGVEVFVKHVGISQRYQPLVNDIKINYNNKTNVLNWTQPIENEEFEYTIYIDKNLARFAYTLCSIIDVTKLGHYNEVLRTDSKVPNITIDFTKPELNSFNNFQVLIIAEQINNGKLTIMSDVYDPNKEGSDEEDKDDNKNGKGNNSNIGLLVLISILSVVIIAGGIFTFILYRKYKDKGEVSKKNKETSMALINSTKNDKLVESQAQETNQIDP